jgi:plastocyanin
MKINQPRPSLPVTQPRNTEAPPPRPPPRLTDNDGFEVTRSGPLSLGTASVEAPGDQVIALARSVMGTKAHDLKLANNTKLGEAMQDWVPDTVNCANFVSGLLEATGQIDKGGGHAAVTTLVSKLKKNPNFTQVTLENAKPGDVVAFEYTKKDGTKGHHVVVYEGRDAKGQPQFIGSNNINKDGTQSVSRSTGVPKGWSAMAVMHYSGPPPKGVPTPSPSSPTAPTGPTGPSSPAAPSAGTASTVDGITTDKSTWMRTGTSGAGVEDLQKKLAAAGFDPGPLDGSFGPKTQAAVRAYQQANGLQVDGIVGPETRGALMGQPKTPGTPSTPGPTPSGGETPPGPVDNNTPVTPSGNTATARELEAMALKKHGPEFLQKVKEMSTRLGVKPEWVLAVMKNESGMSTTAKNPNGGATGLIQFMPATARGLGTTTDALSKMSATEQLKYVEKYFAPFKGKIKSGTDLYMATFWPAGVGKPDSYNIGGAEVARVNKIFDLDKNGQITAGEFRRYYAQKFPELAG